MLALSPIARSLDDRRVEFRAWTTARSARSSVESLHHRGERDAGFRTCLGVDSGQLDVRRCRECTMTEPARPNEPGSVARGRLARDDRSAPVPRRPSLHPGASTLGRARRPKVFRSPTIFPMPHRNAAPRDCRPGSMPCFPVPMHPEHETTGERHRRVLSAGTQDSGFLAASEALLRALLAELVQGGDLDPGHPGGPGIGHRRHLKVSSASRDRAPRRAGAADPGSPNAASAGRIA